MLTLLEELVNTESGSYDKPGVDAVGGRIAAFLSGHGIPVTTIPVEGYGDALKAEVSGSGGGNRPVVLMGHRDTVFPKGEVAQRPFRIADGRAYGPGVADIDVPLTKISLPPGVKILSVRPNVIRAEIIRRTK